VWRGRYRRIVFFFSRVLLGLVAWELIAPAIGLGGWAERTRSRRLRRIAVRFRALALRMGGVLIKVGQFLSSRLDVLPVEITSELAGLQDEVPAVAFEAIRAVAEAELGAPLAARFAAFDETPLAAASLGQVHRARLPAADDAPGALVDVVVKVQRPHIESIIETDLAALRTVGGWLARYPGVRRRADVPALLAEFTRVLHEEIDYLAEGRNAETFAANFKGRPGIRVPKVAWSHTTPRVLTLENVYGLKLTDHAALAAANIDRREVARRFNETYLQQIFVDGFFHADPHPGNLFVVPTERGFELRFVDFGMVGRLTPETRAGLRELAVAVATKEAGRIVRAAQKLGVLLPEADLALLERVEARLLERFWGQSIGQLADVSFQEMRDVAGEFRTLLYDLPFQIPEDLILLGRTLGIVSGMCAGLDRDFNPWAQLQPFARRLIAEDTAPIWEVYMEKLGALGRALFSVPRQAESVLKQMEKGEMVLRMPALEEQAARLELTVRRLTGGVVFAGFLLSGVLLVMAARPWVAAPLLVGAAVSLGWVMLAGRSRRD